jgi:hypothetical protein
MSHLKFVLILLVVVPAIFSCSVQKRYHRKGYTIIWKKTTSAKNNQNRKNSVNLVRSEKNIDRTKFVTQKSHEIKAETEIAKVDEPIDLSQVDSIDHTFNVNTSNKSSLFYNKLQNNTLSKTTTKITRLSLFQNKSGLSKVKSITKKRDFENAGRDLGLAGVFLLLGLLIALIGVLLSAEVLAIVAFVCFCISGIFFLLFIFEGLISILTLGML